MRLATVLLGAATLGCGATLGGGITLGGGDSLGVHSVKGIDWEMQNFLVARIMVEGLLISVGVDGVMAGAGGDMGSLGIQLVNSYQSLEMAIICSWWLVDGASLTAQEIKLRAWMILSSLETFV